MTLVDHVAPHDHPDVLTLGPARLLAGAQPDRRLSLSEHRTLHPDAPSMTRDDLVRLSDAVRLRGRGGAAFPVARKLAGVAPGAGVHVVVNGSESEPASHKDRVLMRHVPHLVLDGALLVGRALGTTHVTITVHDVESARALRAACAERLDAQGLVVDESRARFVGGEARSVVNRLSGRPAVPGGRRVLPTESGVGGAPTFLSNVETFTQIAWLAAHGPASFVEVGTSHEPGTTLMTCHGDVASPGVVEVPHGARLDQVTGRPGAVLLVGGYHGTWVHDTGLTVDRDALSARGATWGAGVVAVLPPTTCAWGEVTRVAGWLAAQSARQCGPCTFGLPAVADDVAAVGAGDAEAVARLRRRLGLVTGRGACAHPDGATRFLASALDVLSDEVQQHLDHGSCGRPVLGCLPLGGGRA